MSIIGHTKDVADICITWANNAQRMTWETSQHSNTTIYNFAFNGGPAPVANIHTIDVNNIASCWELPLLALVAGGYGTLADIYSLLKNDPACDHPSTLQPPIFAGITPYDATTSLNKGHLVFFDGMNHMAILTGKRVGVNNEAQVVSFWAWDGLQFPAPTGPMPGPIANTYIRLTTIEWLSSRFAAAPQVILSKPAWR